MRGKSCLKKDLKPVHPGEVLLEEFLRPMNLSQNRLALDIGVPPRRINEIVLGKRSVTARKLPTSALSGFRKKPKMLLGNTGRNRGRSTIQEIGFGSLNMTTYAQRHASNS